MTNHILILAAVMLLAGVFGGLVNYYLYNQNDPDITSLPRCIVVGVGAAFLVPVILDVLNSELVLESQGDPSRVLIFTGFCLISAILSRFFISNVSERIANEAQVARETSKSVQQDLRTIQNELLPLIDTETEQDLYNTEPDDIADADLVDQSSLNVLRCLASGRYIFRSLQGLSREVNENDESVMLRTLNILVVKNLAGKVSSKNGVRWHITEKGRRYLEASA